ncbi:MAG: right-handed parallel beta-helix repeat-containing protein [Planctomycetes bacterium]|nr:right-handed parallel beta-helix repeat-containing protein [Planctomycetota bacterium]
MFNTDSTISVINCTFISNSAGHKGGGMINGGGSLTFINCSFRRNSAERGGGMINSGGSTTFVNCTFTGNLADEGSGGGMRNYNSNPVVLYCSFIGNFAEEYGGGMSNEYRSRPNIYNCIFWGNTASTGHKEVYTGPSCRPEIGYCNIAGSYYTGLWDISLGIDGGGNIDVEPMFVDAGSGDYRLMAGSPCIDAGDNGGVTTIFDLDGRPRVVDGDGDGVAVVDMGAYEFTTNHRPVAEAGGDLVVWAEPNGVALVRLDGSGSYDADGHTLTYKWSWTVDGQEYVSSGGDGIVNLLDFAWWAKNTDQTLSIQWLTGIAEVWLQDVNTLATPSVFDVTPSGPYAVIELPVGKYTITLLVNDDLEDSEPNTCKVAVLTAGDLDQDGQVDVDDLNILLAGRNEPANGPNDPRDLDGDGMVTVLDARKLITLFTGG